MILCNSLSFPQAKEDAANKATNEDLDTNDWLQPLDDEYHAKNNKVYIDIDTGIKSDNSKLLLKSEKLDYMHFMYINTIDFI